MSCVEALKIAPSLLSADFGHLAEAAQQAEAAGAEYLHFDVMDGQFVPNLTMGPNVLKALRPVSKAFFDVHLMIIQPERILDDFVHAGANGITVQAEVCVHLQRTLAHIRSLGAKAGVALNPSTPLNVLEYVLGDLDLILVMTVNPGFGGQAFLPSMLPKIARVREMIAHAPQPIELEVDGGIAPDTVPLVTAEGANVLVAGTALYGHKDGLAASVQQLRQAAK